MRKDVAQKLYNSALYAADVFSNPDRALNTLGEKFVLERVVPLSEFTAAVYYKKDTTKTALAFFYWVNTGDGQWRYFFPSDSHILGMEKFGALKVAVEASNYDANFVYTMKDAVIPEVKVK